MMRRLLGRFSALDVFSILFRHLNQISRYRKLKAIEEKLSDGSQLIYETRSAISSDTVSTHQVMASVEARSQSKYFDSFGNSSEFNKMFHVSADKNRPRGACFKAIDWRSESFMACPVEYFSIFGFQQHLHILHRQPNRSNFTLIQIIHEMQESKIQDADFVVHSNQLFLLVAYFSDASRLTIYRWTHPYFYKEAEEAVTSPKQLLSIDNAGHVTIVLIQGAQHFRTHECHIFKMIPISPMQTLIIRDQVIRAPFEPCVGLFALNDELLLLITDKTLGSRLYLRKSSKFTFWTRIEKIKQCKTTFVGISAQKQILIIHNSKMQLFIFEVSPEFTQSRTLLFLPGISSINDVQAEGYYLKVVLLGDDGKLKRRSINLSRKTGIPKFQNLGVVLEKLKRRKEDVEQMDNTIQAMKRTFSKVLITNERRNITGIIKCKRLVLRNGFIKHLRIVYPEQSVSHMGRMNTTLTKALKLIRYLDKVELPPITQLRLWGNLNVLFGEVNSVAIPQLSPAVLLTYKDRQFIHAPLNFTTVIVNWLLADSVNNISTDDLVLRTNTFFPKPAVMSQVECGKLKFRSAPIVNDINLNEVVTFGSKPRIITGLKTCKNLAAEKLKVFSVEKLELERNCCVEEEHPD
ncbi:uncharacterized protein [Bemisia tabaci]